MSTPTNPQDLQGQPAETKKTYTPPLLTEFGKISEITLGGGGTDFDEPTGGFSAFN